MADVAAIVVDAPVAVMAALMAAEHSVVAAAAVRAVDAIFMNFICNTKFDTHLWRAMIYLPLALAPDAVSLMTNALERAIGDAVNFVVVLESDCLDLAAVAAVPDGNSVEPLEACREIDLAVEMVDRVDSTDESAVLVVDDDYNFRWAAVDCVGYVVRAL